MATPSTPNDESGLTDRERVVAALVAQGLTNRQIADKLFISERTADGHLEHIREKLGVGTRTQIATWYVARSRQGHVGDLPTASIGWPPQPTALLGRARELLELRELMVRPDVRLVTLTGPPGTGKTRLALSSALDLAGGFEDGAHFVDLSPIYDPSLVLSAIGQVVGVQPLLQALAAALRPKRTLIVLDNFEQILPAAVQIAELLAACPDLKVMVTSRECLHLLRWEHEYPVHPLQLPDLDQLPPAHIVSAVPAVALFVDRALARNPRFALDDETTETVAKICVRLDGLPLAIELAAARAKFQTPTAILSGLQGRDDLTLKGGADFPRRHQTLHEAIGASHALLSNEERILFRRLGPFVGGFGLESLKAVCAGGRIATGNLGRVLDQLVDKSLVHVEVTGSRYRLLETIREYALNSLRDSGESESIISRHSNYFVDLAEQTRSELHGPAEAASFDRLHLELDNFRAVLARALAEGDHETGLRLGAALSRFWGWRGFIEEGRNRLAAFVGQADERHLERVPDAIRELGYLEARHFGPRAARVYFARYLPMARRINDHKGAAIALFYMGEGFYLDETNWQNVDIKTCRTLLEEALGEARKCDYRPVIAYSLRALGMVSHLQHDESAAAQLIDESLVIERELGDNRGIALGLLFRGRIAFDLAHHDVAAQCYAESLRRYSEGDYVWAIPDLLEWFSRLAVIRSKPLVALRLAGAADALRQRIGLYDSPFWYQDFDQRMNAIAGGDARRHPEWSAGQTLGFEQAANLAYAVWDGRI